MNKPDFYYKGIPVWMEAPECEHTQSGAVIQLYVPQASGVSSWSLGDDGKIITRGLTHLTSVLCVLCEDGMGSEFYTPVPVGFVDENNDK